MLRCAVVKQLRDQRPGMVQGKVRPQTCLLVPFLAHFLIWTHCCWFAFAAAIRVLLAVPGPLHPEQEARPVALRAGVAAACVRESVERRVRLLFAWRSFDDCVVVLGFEICVVFQCFVHTYCNTITFAFACGPSSRHATQELSSLLSCGFWLLQGLRPAPMQERTPMQCFQSI